MKNMTSAEWMNDFIGPNSSHHDQWRATEIMLRLDDNFGEGYDLNSNQVGHDVDC